MLADSHRYRISTKNYIKIGQAVSKEYGNENCDTRILYNRYESHVKGGESIAIFKIMIKISIFCHYVQKNFVYILRFYIVHNNNNLLYNTISLGWV